MAGFLYFFPGVESGQVTPQLVEGAGCGQALRDVLDDWRPGENVTLRNVAHGPSGGGGCVVFAEQVNGGDGPRDRGYKPERQEWHDRGAFWLGLDINRRPKPEDLKRPQQVPGYRYTLGDGREWECPLIRRPAGGTFAEPRWHVGLPQNFGYAPDGSFQARVKPGYQEYWELSGKLWDTFIGNGDVEQADALGYCLTLLALNYRVGPSELTVLEVIDSTNYVDVVGAAIDRPLIEELLHTNLDGAPQKKTPDRSPTTASSSPGPEEKSTATDPAAENSTSAPEASATARTS